MMKLCIAALLLVAVAEFLLVAQLLDFDAIDIRVQKSLGLGQEFCFSRSRTCSWSRSMHCWAAARFDTASCSSVSLAASMAFAAVSIACPLHYISLTLPCNLLACPSFHSRFTHQFTH